MWLAERVNRSAQSSGRRTNLYGSIKATHICVEVCACKCKRRRQASSRPGHNHKCWNVAITGRSECCHDNFNAHTVCEREKKQNKSNKIKQQAYRVCLRFSKFPRVLKANAFQNCLFKYMHGGCIL